MRLLGFSGHSGAGKTTLIEALLPEFGRMGLAVNVIKHSHHDVELEPPHKDSARLRRAGAQEVLLATPYRYAIMCELHGAIAEPSFESLLARLSPSDLTLVEGYHHIAMPRIVVHRAALSKPPRGLDDANLLAIACDTLPDLPPHLPQWPLDDPQRIAMLIRQVLCC